MSLRVFALLSLTAAAFAQDATTTRTSTYTFPLVGVAPSEGIEVNLINLASNPTSGGVAACTGTVKFTAVSSGTVLAGGGNFSLAANQATSIVPTVGNNIATASNRILIRADVTTTFNPGGPCTLGSTLTTFDNATGVTHVLLVGSTPLTATPLAVLNP